MPTDFLDDKQKQNSYCFYDFLRARDPDTGEQFIDYMHRRQISIESAYRGFELAQAIQNRNRSPK